MAIFTDPIREHADFGPGDAEWLHLLVGDWQMVADLAFADLALWFPHPEFGYVALAHVRPSTTHTVFHADFVGEGIRSDLQPLVDKAWESRTIERSNETNWSSDMALRVEAVPDGPQRPDAGHRHDPHGPVQLPDAVPAGADLPAVRLRPAADGHAGTVARLCLAHRFAPRRTPRRGRPHQARRRGHRAVREPQRRLRVPPARRRRVAGGHGRLAEVTAGLLKDRRMVDETLPLVVTGRMPWRSEIESRGVSLSLRAIPLRDEQQRFGALVLCRDVSELRRREMELVTKDATIREIHHRVKNNLQTVAALLRMQSRRMVSDEAKQGLEQAMRRVATIALVHETLSQGLTQSVDFDELIGRQFRLSAEVASPSQQVKTERSGLFGELPSDFATPLALVINELVTNAVEHGLEGRTGTVWLIADRSEERGRRGAAHRDGRRRRRRLPDTPYVEGLGPADRAHPGDQRTGRHHPVERREGGGTAVQIGSACHGK